MAKFFVNSLKEALKQYCSQNGIGTSLTPAELDLYCHDLAWAGLDDPDTSSPWMDSNNLTDEDRTRILKRQQIELRNEGHWSGNVDFGYGIYNLTIPQIGTKACP